MLVFYLTMKNPLSMIPDHSKIKFKVKIKFFRLNPKPVRAQELTPIAAHPVPKRWLKVANRLIWIAI